MAILPVVIGYGLMTAMTNLDVLVSYFALKETDLGIYSASSVFPKAILVIMTPVSQMLFPMMFQRGAERRDFLTIVAKICVTVLFASAAAAGATWLLSDYLCGGTFGLKLCSIPPLTALLVAAIPLALLRIAALFQLARGRDALLLFLVAPIAIYAYFVLKTPLDVDSLASSFAVFAYAGLAFFAILSGVRELVARAASGGSSASLGDPLA
jgi:O-antigen/teichoic acid export membrane protein